MVNGTFKVGLSPSKKKFLFPSMITLHELRQPDNEIWSVNRTYQEKYFSLKIIAENEAEKLVPEGFLFFKKALYQVRESGLQLISLYFDSPQISIQ